MLSTLPTTPGRGRSRFSKALPTPRELRSQKSPARTVLLGSPLPQLRKEELAPSMGIKRKPVEISKPTPATSISSDSSDSESLPALTRSSSRSSTDNEKDSLSGIDSPPPAMVDAAARTKPKIGLPANPKIWQGDYNSTPSQTLWKRRSLKTDKGLKVSELRLEGISNGATVSPPRQKEQSARQQPSAPERPIATQRPAPPQPDLMGNKISQLKKKGFEETSSTESQHEEAPTQPYPSLQLLPSPAYLKKENRTPSPRGNRTPDLPPKSLSRGTSSTTGSKSSESTLQQATTSPESRTPSETSTITSVNTQVRAAAPQQKPIVPIITTTAFTPEPTPTPTHRRTPSLATDFPTLSSPVADGGISMAPPLELGHFECYQEHKYMRSSRNSYCPVACMVCEQSDMEIRWRCTWCCLSACGKCMQVLSEVPRKDLRQCLEKIKE